MVFLLRLSPVFPFNLLNYALGLTRVRLWDYAVASLGIATAALVVLPYVQVRDVESAPGLKPYTEQQLRGRQ